MGDDERRIEERRPFVLKVRFESGGAYWDSWTENLSSGGFFVRTDETFGIGDPITLNLSFPKLFRPVPVRGHVAWHRPANEESPAGIGIRVDEDGSRRRLAELALCAQGRVGPGDRPFRVLIVEDAEIAMRMYERTVRRMGDAMQSLVELAFAVNGSAALEHIGRDPLPDLVITDLYMPILNGLELVRAIRADERTRGLLVILVTHGADDEAELAQQAGVDCFLRKPLQFGQLLETIVRLRLGRGGLSPDRKEILAQTASAAESSSQRE